MYELIEFGNCELIKKKWLIDKDGTVVIGNGSTVEWNDHNGMKSGFGTADSATLTVRASNVVINNLKVKNSFDYVTNRLKRDENVSKGMGLQAVAVYVAPGSDNVIFSNCEFDSFQDTLFADGEVVLFDNCKISGNVDFIFGKAKAVYTNCLIVSKDQGIITAPSTKEDSDMGLFFFNCTFTCTDNVPSGSVYLARPWHPGGKPGVKSCVRFDHCKFDRHINKNLWTDMKDTFGVVHTPQESRFSIDDSSLEQIQLNV